MNLAVADITHDRAAVGSAILGGQLGTLGGGVRIGGRRRGRRSWLRWALRGSASGERRAQGKGNERGPEELEHAQWCSTDGASGGLQCLVPRRTTHDALPSAFVFEAHSVSIAADPLMMPQLASGRRESAFDQKCGQPRRPSAVFPKAVLARAAHVNLEPPFSTHPRRALRAAGEDEAVPHARRAVVARS